MMMLSRAHRKWERIGRDHHDEIGQIFGYYNTKAQAIKTYLEIEKTAIAVAICLKEI